MRQVRKGVERPCHCVFRAIFKACYHRFRECAASSPLKTVSLEYCGGPGGRRVYSRKREEFMADFTLLAQRALTEDEHRIFRYYYLLSAGYKLCCRQMKIDNGEFFHYIYRIQRKLGRAFAETEPYALYPVSEYFAGVAQKIGPEALPIKEAPKKKWVFALPLSA
jgi:hypothetical protein